MATIQDELQLTSTDATEVNLSIAGTGSRSYAFLIDWHIRILVALAWLIGMAVLFGMMKGQGFWDKLFDNVGSFAFYVIILPPALFYFLYHPVLEIALKGRTPGKRAAGIRVVTLDGQTPDVSALLIRNIFRLIDSLPIFYVVGLVFVLLSPRQVRIGDMAAGTLLAHEKKLTNNAFERFARPNNGTLDLRTMELAQDLLERWKTLAPDKRSEIAAKLITSQGETLPSNVSKHALDQELHERLMSLTHASRT
jgi:uncharacterized RDD family membrane protein YckC